MDIYKIYQVTAAEIFIFQLSLFTSIKNQFPYKRYNLLKVKKLKKKYLQQCRAMKSGKRTALFSTDD